MSRGRSLANTIREEEQGGCQLIAAAGWLAGWLARWLAALPRFKVYTASRGKDTPAASS